MTLPTPRGTLLEVQDLSVSFSGGPVAVDGVSLSIRAGESLGIVGASGSGKTTTALGILGLAPAGARVTGRVRWKGTDLLGLDPPALRRIRGREIALVPQDPMTALNPMQRVDCQVAEALRAHQPRLSRSAALARAAELLESMDLPRERLAGSGHPFEWSGGMRQRALIAMAVANRPALLIADEPTTALDASTQAVVLRLLRKAQRETGAALLLIAHDMAVIARMATRVAVMREGRIIETSCASCLARYPRNPYTAELVAAAGSGRPDGGTEQPDGGTGRPNGGTGRPNGGTGRPDGGTERGREGAPRRPSGAERAPDPPPLLEVRNLSVRYPLRRGWRREEWLTAVRDVSFTLAAGEMLAIVGASGAGKSSLARALVGLEEAGGGRILLAGEDLTRLRGSARRAARSGIQIVFQEHHASLNPRRRVGATIAEPLRIHGRTGRTGRTGRSEAMRRARELLREVGLPSDHAERYPHALSGGERQRVAIARALALEPRVLVLDEPVTSLDALTRVALLRLLADLQARIGVAYVLVAHDLHLVRRVADRIAVMRGGRFVEVGTADDIYARARHPYTRELMAASLGSAGGAKPG